MARGWQTATESVSDGVILRNWVAGPGEQYAAAQEFGATITARNAKALWIPAPGNLTPAGVARISPREAIAQGGFIRNGVFFSKPLVKGDAKGMGPHIVPLFFLKRSVKIPARMGATTLFKQRLEQAAQGITFIAAEYV